MHSESILLYNIFDWPDKIAFLRFVNDLVTANETVYTFCVCVCIMCKSQFVMNHRLIDLNNTRM